MEVAAGTPGERRRARLQFRRQLLNRFQRNHPDSGKESKPFPFPLLACKCLMFCGYIVSTERSYKIPNLGSSRARCSPHQVSDRREAPSPRLAAGCPRSPGLSRVRRAGKDLERRGAGQGPGPGRAAAPIAAPGAGRGGGGTAAPASAVCAGRALPSLAASGRGAAGAAPPAPPLAPPRVARRPPAQPGRSARPGRANPHTPRAALSVDPRPQGQPHLRPSGSETLGPSAPRPSGRGPNWPGTDWKVSTGKFLFYFWGGVTK